MGGSSRKQYSTFVVGNTVSEKVNLDTKFVRDILSWELEYWWPSGDTFKTIVFTD